MKKLNNNFLSGVGNLAVMAIDKGMVFVYHTEEEYVSIRRVGEYYLYGQEVINADELLLMIMSYYYYHSNNEVVNKDIDYMLELI